MVMDAWVERRASVAANYDHAHFFEKVPLLEEGPTRIGRGENQWTFRIKPDPAQRRQLSCVTFIPEP